MGDSAETGLHDDDEAFELLKELEQQTPDEIRRQRSTHRVELRAQVLIQPGNTGEMLKLKVKAVLADLSAGGCRVSSPLPLRVGDVYRLTFEREDLDLPLTFARCLRCRMLREDVFEAGFQFFSPLHPPVAALRRGDPEDRSGGEAGRSSRPTLA